MIAALIALWRVFPPRVWAALGVVLLILILALGIYFSGRSDERDDLADRQAQTEARASAGRETAATERHLDNAAIADRQKERDDAAEALPDSLPDERERRRRCRQLRDAGRDHPLCRGLEGSAQAGPA